MRLLSQYSRYSLQIFGDGEKIVTDGKGVAMYVTTRKPVIAFFDKLGLMDHEADVALEKLNFTALPEGVPPLTRVGVWDSEAYCLENYEDPDERRDMQIQIDERVRDLAKKFSPRDFIIVDTPKAPIPWPSYDNDPVEDILKLQERLEVSPEVVRRYEQENQDRPEIVEPMEELEGSLLPDTITVDA